MIYGLYAKCVTRRSGLNLLTFARMMAANSSSRKANKLINERSPYLLQHAYNPVDWYPWGTEAFQKAKTENKIIFLSVGYSTCHWCHVMEKESFENPDIGEILSEKFVPIKVDREERPDVDKVYMTFIQATSGGGGWPMSVWLTPDLKPIVGGTYFPPTDHFRRPGFKTVLLNILAKWESDRTNLENKGSEILDALKKHTSVSASSGCIPDGSVVSERCREQLAKRYDSKMGGFQSAPKFPQPCNFNFMFRLFASQRDTEKGVESLEMCLHTLRKMNSGGIHDHVAQGFHRYSTDEDWHVPHFEKMLYDQAQLAVSYCDAYQITKDEEFADVAKDILQYVDRDLSHKDGGFYSAEDADSLPTHDSSDKREGAFCVWTKDELETLLSKEIKEGLTLSDIFCHHFGVEDIGNVNPYKDPHGELQGQNVLIIKGSLQDTARKFDLEVETTKSMLEEARKILFDERKKRPAPHLDNKMLTAWNGLMLSGFARSAQVLDDSRYRDRALTAATFIKTHLYKDESKILLRSAYVTEDGSVTVGESPVEGFADDYAFLIRGLLDLYECCYDDAWIEWANQLQQTMNTLFWDEDGGGYFTSAAKDSSIVMRLKEDQDGAEPSANSVAANNLLRLSQILSDDSYRELADRLLTAFSERLIKIPIALPEMASACMAASNPGKQIIISGDPYSADTQKLIKCVHSHFLPNKILILANSQSHFLLEQQSMLGDIVKDCGKSAAYVCENFTCQLPVYRVEDLDKLLEEMS